MNSHRAAVIKRRLWDQPYAMDDLVWLADNLIEFWDDDLPLPQFTDSTSEEIIMWVGDLRLFINFSDFSGSIVGEDFIEDLDLEDYDSWGMVVRIFSDHISDSEEG